MTLPAAVPDWAYFLDVDGTLIEFAATPDAVQVDDALLHMIVRLHRRCGGALALVSGRKLSDVDRLLRHPGLPLAGQHGLELRDGQGRAQRFAAEGARPVLIAERLRGVAARHPGLRIEDKGATLAVHYRLAPQLGGYLHRLMRHLVSELGNGLLLQPGKRVLEVMPRGRDKGSAILWFMARPPFRGRRPVFVGDDLTDEHGFAVINRLHGISVKVGRGRSLARYRLKDVAAVRGWLAPLATEGLPERLD